MGTDHGREFMMPVPPEGAAMQFFIEAMKANTAVLENVNQSMVGMQAEVRGQLGLIHDVRERVIRIESNKVDRRVEGLEGRVDKLEQVNDRREGATGTWSWLVKHLPNLAVIAGAILAAVFITLQATGKI